MVDDIASRVSSLRITAEEDKLIALDDVPENEKNCNFDLPLVGKVMAIRTYNFNALKRTLNQIWMISKGALFRPIESDRFVVQFACQRDKNKVLAERPWTSDQHLVVLQEIEDDIQLSNISLNYAPSGYAYIISRCVVGRRLMFELLAVVLERCWRWILMKWGERCEREFEFFSILLNLCGEFNV